jgi:hypothetical protein
MIIVLVPRTFIRFYSVRTGQTLLNANRLEGALIVYGDARPDRYKICLDGEEVRIDGTLWDRVAPAISFGDDAMRYHTKVLIDTGVLPDEYDGSWQRDRS